MTMERFKKGAKVRFSYKNSVGRTVLGYGHVVDYRNRFYYISIDDGMVIKVYCSRVTWFEDTSSFITPRLGAKTEVIKKKEYVPQKTIISEQLKDIRRVLGKILMCVGSIGILLIFLLYK